jgi:hypothetical protein
MKSNTLQGKGTCSESSEKVKQEKTFKNCLLFLGFKERESMNNEYSHPETHCQQEPWHDERPHFLSQMTDRDLSNPN